MSEPWYRVANVEEIPSPALLLYPDRIERNIRRMRELVGGEVARLRPHVKTCKCPEIVRMQLTAGIGKFKCATIAEMEMTLAAGAKDVQLAYQPVGPNIGRLARLGARFPEARLSAIADSSPAAEAISNRFAGEPRPLPLLVDIDCGLGRSGIEPGDEALALCRRVEALPGVEFAGLHLYDGHIRASDADERRSQFEEAFAPVAKFAERLAEAGLRPAEIVGGGTPTFALHGRLMNWQCSPGTCLLWDAGYGTKFPDLGFLPAAALLTRVASKPGSDRLCLDLGHKAVAAENPIENRVRFPELSDARPARHSEEHLVVETAAASRLPVGAALYAIPWHICPTVALHEEAVAIRDGRATGERWPIVARKRFLTV